MGRRGGGRWGAREDDAFLYALEAIGNVRKAAEAIGWTAPTAYQRRDACPAFYQRWRALADRPPPDLGLTIVRGQCVGKMGVGKTGGVPTRPKRVRAVGVWTDESEAAFLDTLAATCNVRLSCDTAGVGNQAVYRRRRDDARFEALWDAALAQGYARMEMELVRAAAESIERLSAEGVEFADRAVAVVSAADVIRLLALHRGRVTGAGGTAGRRAALPPLEEVKADILRKAEAIRAARRPGEGPR